MMKIGKVRKDRDHTQADQHLPGAERHRGFGRRIRFGCLRFKQRVPLMIDLSSFGRRNMGGTGLEPVTPTMSR